MHLVTILINLKSQRKIHLREKKVILGLAVGYARGTLDFQWMLLNHIQIIHILLQSDVISSVRNTSHCPLIHQTAFTHACMHKNLSLTTTKQKLILPIGPKFRGVKVSHWDVWLRSTSTNTQIFQVKYVFN